MRRTTTYDRPPSCCKRNFSAMISDESIRRLPSLLSLSSLPQIPLDFSKLRARFHQDSYSHDNHQTTPSRPRPSFSQGARLSSHGENGSSTHEPPPTSTSSSQQSPPKAQKPPQPLLRNHSLPSLSSLNSSPLSTPTSSCSDALMVALRGFPLSNDCSPK